MHILARGILLTSLSITLLGCEDKKEGNLIKAQDCINKASANSVNSCLNYITGYTSKRSYVLRCSAAFISEGIDEDAIIAAIENIDGKNGGSNPTTPAISALTMSSASVSTAAVEVCTLSESAALTALAQFANLSTSLGSLLGFAQGADPSNIEALLAAYSGTPSDAEKEVLGSAVLSAQSSLCNSKNGLFKDTKACTDIDSAVAAHPNDPAQLADALISNLNNP